MLLDKINNNVSLEKKDILKIVNEYVKKNNLELYLVDVIFNNNNNKCIGSYNRKDKVIILNDDKIVKFCYETSDKLSRIYDINEDYYNYFFNYYYLYILFHELEHAIQIKKYETEKSENAIMFKFLYEICQRLHYSSQVFYSNNYDLFPMEIDANNNGYLKAYNYLSHTKLPKRELKIMKSQYLFSLLYNYERVNKNLISSPVDKLCNLNTNLSRDIITKLTSACELEMDDRLNLGLNITPLEFNNIEKEKRKIILLRK